MLIPNSPKNGAYLPNDLKFLSGAMLAYSIRQVRYFDRKNYVKENDEKISRECRNQRLQLSSGTKRKRSKNNMDTQADYTCDEIQSGFRQIFLPFVGRFMKSV